MRASSASGGYPIAIRMVKRSSCASGSGYVPSYSIGFWVAMTMNGSGSACVTPSIVTWFSCIDSSSAACVFGEARLISSTSRRFVKTGPGRNSNSFDRWLKTLTPVTSDGSRSGVNCRRENEQSIERESAFASIVFPTPGKSSMIRCPSLTRQSTQRRSVSSGARTTRATLSLTARRTSADDATETRSLPARSIAPQQPLDLVEDFHRDVLLPSPRYRTLAGLGEQHDFVLCGIEADVVTRNVVVDDEVDTLVAQLPARALEPVAARRGRRGDELDAPGRRDAEIGAHERDPRTPALSLGGEGDAHPPGRAVAEKAHGVDRLARAARGDDDTFAGQRAVLGRKQLVDSVGDLARLRHPSDARAALRELALGGPDELDAARTQELGVRLGRGMRPHPVVHGRGGDERAPMSKGGLGEEAVREAVCELRHGVGGQRRDHVEVGPLEVRIQVFACGATRERGERLRGHEALCAARHDRDYLVAVPDEAADQLACLVGGDPPAHPHENPRAHVPNCAL